MGALGTWQPWAAGGVCQGAGECSRTFAVPLQQVQCHALCRFGAHTGQATQGVHEVLQGRAELHDWGNVLKTAA